MTPWGVLKSTLKAFKLTRDEKIFYQSSYFKNLLLRPISKSRTVVKKIPVIK